MKTRYNYGGKYRNGGGPLASLTKKYNHGGAGPHPRGPEDVDELIAALGAYGAGGDNTATVLDPEEASARELPEYTQEETGQNLFDGVTEKEAMDRIDSQSWFDKNNPVFGRGGFDIKNKSHVKEYQNQFNEIAKDAGVPFVQTDGKWGLQTQSAQIPTEDIQVSSQSAPSSAYTPEIEFIYPPNTIGRKGAGIDRVLGPDLIRGINVKIKGPDGKFYSPLTFQGSSALGAENQNQFFLPQAFGYGVSNMGEGAQTLGQVTPGRPDINMQNQGFFQKGVVMLPENAELRAKGIYNPESHQSLDTAGFKNLIDLYNLMGPEVYDQTLAALREAGYDTSQLAIPSSASEFDRAPYFYGTESGDNPFKGMPRGINPLDILLARFQTSMGGEQFPSTMIAGDPAFTGGTSKRAKGSAAPKEAEIRRQVEQAAQILRERFGANSPEVKEAEEAIKVVKKEQKKDTSPEATNARIYQALAELRAKNKQKTRTSDSGN